VKNFLLQIELAAPLFVLVLAGYLLIAVGRWPRSISAAMTRFVFAVAVPALLFRLMSDLSRLPPVDARLLIAYFGGCLILFAIGRLVAARLFRLDGASQSVFALGGIFSNNVLLGVPLAQVLLGDAVMPAVALLLVFNSLILWVLVTVSVEWARNGRMSSRALTRITWSVLKNPIVASILLGVLLGLSGWKLPALIDRPLALIGDSATPLALVVLGMGLAEYGVRSGWRPGAAITALKLIGQPLIVWGLCIALGRPLLETQAAVLLASLSVGVNVYLMAREFQVMESAVATSMVLSTALAAVTTPLALALVAP